jgi:hypothetical protein
MVVTSMARMSSQNHGHKLQRIKRRFFPILRSVFMMLWTSEYWTAEFVSVAAKRICISHTKVVVEALNMSINVAVIGMLLLVRYQD